MALLFSALSFNALACEDEAPVCDTSHRWWINLGLGTGTSINAPDVSVSGPAAQISFNGMLTDKLFATLETTAVVESEGLIDRSIVDLGLLLGYKSKHPKWYWSGAAGIAYTKAEIEYNGRYWYGSTEETSVGIPVQGQLFWTPVKHFGIGLIGHAVASRNSYAVAMLGIQIS